ncbi:serine hydrolase domain-containing protein [Paludibaculum fermentans]|uniref:Beta-lactamase family protein n=1 Tax=Paludibaculum fermentans TaxID=1473598 RepID=A0A7S7SL50_PALFE|nr:serine hydrolase domain-containing protein [Paludibaculum fermentans]QOY89019.1 beta-lactamase family protein [Paludibaculum fermentans]
MLRIGSRFTGFAAITTLVAGLASAGHVPTGKPEDVGMSTERLQRIHEAIQRHVDAGAISGAVTMVARRGKVVHFQAHGLMDLDSKKPMSTDAIFRIASMTKPITGVAVMMMVEEGKLRLNDPVSRFIPEFKDMKVALPTDSITPRPVGARAADPGFYLVPAYREITVRDLLTHTSGLVSGGLGAKEAPKINPRQPSDTLATYVPRLAAVPLDFQPGTQWAYSGGAGPEVLGRIVEIVSGMPYDQFLRTRIFEPLGMKDTFFYPPDDRRPRMVTLYSKSPQGLKKADNQDGFSTKTFFGAGGSLMSTAEDYLQFAQMLCNGGKLNGHVLLSPRTVQLMASNHVGGMFNGKLGRPAAGMGYGLLVGVVEDSVAAGLRVSTGSFGWDGAYGTQAWIDPAEKMVTIVMIQTQVTPVQRDFENAVMQAILE